MRPYHVQVNKPGVRLAREGPTLVIINASMLTDPSHSRDLGPNTSSYVANATDVLVGFDRSPRLTGGAYDAIAPAYAVTTLSVPDTVREVVLEIPPAAPGAASNPLNHTAAGGPTAAAADPLIDWSSCPAAPSIIPITGLLPTITGSGISDHFIDAAGSIWTPHPSFPVLDQSLGFGNGKYWMRPQLAASGVDPIHVVTVANTIFSMLGPNNFLRGVTGQKTVHRIYVSVSVATLVVIGTVNLTVGSPGVGELWRGLIPAGVATPIEFGAGMDVDQSGVTGSNPWQAYTAAAVTFDASVIGG